MSKSFKHEEIPFVGMFYALGGSLYYVILPVTEGDRQADDVSTNTTHYEWWQYIYRLLRFQNPGFDIEDHEYVPRGRVIFNAAEDTYYLYVDKCIRKSKKMMADIFKTMHLPKEKTRIVLDFHYECHKCRKE